MFVTLLLLDTKGITARCLELSFPFSCVPYLGGGLENKTTELKCYVSRKCHVRSDRHMNKILCPNFVGDVMLLSPLLCRLHCSSFCSHNVLSRTNRLTDGRTDTIQNIIYSVYP